MTFQLHESISFQAAPRHRTGVEVRTVGYHSIRPSKVEFGEYGMVEMVDPLKALEERTIRKRLGCNRQQAQYFVPWGTAAELNELLEKVGDNGFWSRESLDLAFLQRFRRPYESAFGEPEPYDYVFDELYTTGTIKEWFDRLSNDPRLQGGK